MGHELDSGIKKYYTVSTPPKMEDVYEDFSAEEKEARGFGENADNQDNLLTNLNKADFVLFVLNCLTFPHCGGEAQNKILTNIKPERTHRCRKEIRVRIYSFTYQTV